MNFSSKIGPTDSNNERRPQAKLIPELNRRNFLTGASTVGAAAWATAPPALAQRLPGSELASVAPLAPTPADAPPSVPACKPADQMGPASRNQAGFHKNISRLVDLNGSNQGGQYWRYSTLVTPVEDFFIRNEYPTPSAALDRRVDPRHWQLKIHGDAVENPMTLTYNDLLRLTSRAIMSNMECAGNGRSLFWEQQGMTEGPSNKVGGTGWGLGGIGCAEWQYVPMSVILGMVGVKKSAKHCLFWSGVDGKQPGTASDTGRPMPMSHLLKHANDIGLAFKMNGNDLTADHGAPVRVIVPGWCGAASTKWVTEIKIATHNFWVRLNSSAHVLIGPSHSPPIPADNDEFRNVGPRGILGKAVTWSPPRSLLTIPLRLEKQPKLPHNYPLAVGELPRLTAGEQTIRGYAWAPQWGIKSVDVRVNGGRWQAVELVDPEINTYTWRRFRFDWRATPGEHVIETRVTDRKGNQQPTVVPFNEGGFDFWGIPKFHVAVV